ncbi:F-box/WD repeat-containing protein pof11 [Elsinoe australis]|uniref:F-box/WD repeat-containing protein pof11 n=1 Tax=Elsinoe australis TaxID=40998 RepID=A0A2P7YJI4_9PEZI|nr:F-box/WD repeat-containing protein pof11 [Elsinoe australis]
MAPQRAQKKPAKACPTPGGPYNKNRGKEYHQARVMKQIGSSLHTTLAPRLQRSATIPQMRHPAAQIMSRSQSMPTYPPDSYMANSPAGSFAMQPAVSWGPHEAYQQPHVQAQQWNNGPQPLLPIHPAALSISGMLYQQPPPQPVFWPNGMPYEQPYPQPVPQTNGMQYSQPPLRTPPQAHGMQYQQPCPQRVSWTNGVQYSQPCPQMPPQAQGMQHQQPCYQSPHPTMQAPQNLPFRAPIYAPAPPAVYRVAAPAMPGPRMAPQSSSPPEPIDERRDSGHEVPVYKHVNRAPGANTTSHDWSNLHPGLSTMLDRRMAEGDHIDEAPTTTTEDDSFDDLIAWDASA